MLLAAPPVVYGLLSTGIESLNSFDEARLSAFKRLTFEGSQFRTLGALTLPSCLGPTFTVGTEKNGASRIPLEEFPTTAVEIAINDQ